jgi:hypothetical protein
MGKKPYTREKEKDEESLFRRSFQERVKDAYKQRGECDHKHIVYHSTAVHYVKRWAPPKIKREEEGCNLLLILHPQRVSACIYNEREGAEY